MNNPLNTRTRMTHPKLRARATLAAALVLCAGACQAASADGRSKAEIEATYRSERQACLDGRTGQDRATCLKEAGAVRQQALTHGLDNGQSKQQLKQNALVRCDAVPAADRDDCRRLARGEGQQSGSVQGGGVLRQITTRVVEPPPPASAASGPAVTR